MLFLLTLSKNFKRAVVLVVDLLACCVALWSAFALQYSDWWPSSHIRNALNVFALVPLFLVLVMWMSFTMMVQ